MLTQHHPRRQTRGNLKREPLQISLSLERASPSSLSLEGEGWREGVRRRVYAALRSFNMNFLFDFLFVAVTDTFVGLLLAILTVPVNVLTEALIRMLPPAP